MQPLAESSALALLLDLWWRRFPSAVARLSRSLAIALTDGIYLAAWPWLAAVGPPLTFLIGFVPGSVHPSLAPTYTYSLPTMALMVAVAGFGSAPGGWLWVGYV